ncbi:MAG: hypothetical protein DMG09_28370 [Acidobacteria bacterium]|nr:MAG: hypothetical protein DMG09_28370 [Acidobacteriota bacterium]
MRLSDMAEKLPSKRGFARLQTAVRWMVRAMAALLSIGAACSDFFSANPPDEQNLFYFFGPPTSIHFIDARGAFHLTPFVYRYELEDPLNVIYQEQTDARYPLRFFAQGYSYRLFGFIPASRHLTRGSDGSFFYLLGADKLGRDVFARVAAGARISLLVVATGIAIYGLLGLCIGGLAGMQGGWPDRALMRFSEFVLAIPALYLLLALRALLPQKLPAWEATLLGVGTIALVSWPPMARGVRGLIIQLRQAPFVEAARSLGGTPGQIFFLAAPLFLLGEVLLSFLGVGFGSADQSWGSQLRDAQDLRILTDFRWNLAPLFSVFATLLCLNVLTSRPDEREFRRTTL